MKLLRVILIITVVMSGQIFRAHAQTDVTPPKVDVGELQRRWDARVMPDTTFRFDSLTWSLPKARDFRTWEASVAVGITFPTTDIAASDVNVDYAKTNFGVAFSGTHFFTHTFGLKAQYLFAKIEGENAKQDVYGYTTTIKYDATINAVFHIGNIRFLSRTPRLGIYGSLGVGLINFTPKNDSLGIPIDHNIYKTDYNGPNQPRSFANTTEYVIPFTLGVRYLLNDELSLNLEYSLRTTRTDKLDGWWRLLSEDDNYTFASIGITYHFGDRNKGIIEWTNPVQAMYEDYYGQLNNLKRSIDSLKRDSDGDGVSDYFDKEPNTPKGFMVYGNGSAVDFDGDGVPDAIDFCPTVPGPIANHGCPIEKVEKIEKKEEVAVEKPSITKEEEKVISEVFKNLQFETAKSIIRQSSYNSLNELANLLKRRPNYKLLIEGHTDNVGGAAYNLKLSTDRANSVKQYLIDKGVEENRLEAHGYGLTKPVADNKTPEGRQMNRRVDFTIVQ